MISILWAEPAPVLAPMVGEPPAVVLARAHAALSAAGLPTHHLDKALSELARIAKAGAA